MKPMSVDFKIASINLLFETAMRYRVLSAESHMYKSDKDMLIIEQLTAR